MTNYLQHVLKKAKRALSLEEIYEKIERLGQKEDPNFSLSIEDKMDISNTINNMIDTYEVYQSPNLKIILLSKTSFRKGVFHATKKGDGFVYNTISFYTKEGKLVEKTSKYFIPLDETLGAIDGDEVLIETSPNSKNTIIEIIDRSLDKVTGEIYREGPNYFVKPLEKNKEAIKIALEGDYIEGQIVSVKLANNTGLNYYIGEVIEEFHHKDDPGGDVLLEAFKQGMPEGFSNESNEQKRSIPTSVSEQDKVGYLDLTDTEIFTIDGIDTKDKDDAIGFKLLPNGNAQLIVAIANPPAYVPFASPLDQDAYIKGTSYYFSNFVEPMFPHELSSGICSLHDGVERLTKAIIMEITPEGEIVNRSLVKAVIKSRKSMNYDAVNELLEKHTIPEGYEDFTETLFQMQALAKILKRRRKKEGSVNFDRGELSFEYDSDHFPIATKIKRQKSAESLIEEFMLIANKSVSELLTENNLPCLYRVHSTPSHERLGKFLTLLNAVGIPFPYDVEEICGDKHVMQMLTNHINTAGKNIKDVLNKQLIRCLSRAQYSDKNIGHYAVGFEHYSHFTSPIRRLADLALSRIIDECYFEKDPLKKEASIKKWNQIAHEYAEQASRMEVVAESIERRVTHLDSCKYMSRHIGEEVKGIIIEINSNDLIIELENQIEGKVAISDLDGNYTYNAETFSLLSLNYRENYYIGDELRLKVADVNIENRVIKLSVIEKSKENFIPDVKGTNKVAKINAKYKRMIRT